MYSPQPHLLSVPFDSTVEITFQLLLVSKSRASFRNGLDLWYVEVVTGTLNSRDDTGGSYIKKG